MRPSLVLPLSLALLAGAAMPAAAQHLAAARAKVGTAMRAARSFGATTTTPNGVNGTVTFVAPDRYHSAFTASGFSYDVTIAGTTAYVGVNGSAPQRVQAPPAFLTTQTQLRDVPVDALLPDVTVGGVTYGRFQTNTAGPQHDQRLTCTYDKSTYRLQRCENPSLSVVFSRYDDPSNAVAVPAGTP